MFHFWSVFNQTNVMVNEIEFYKIKRFVWIRTSFVISAKEFKMRYNDYRELVYGEFSQENFISAWLIKFHEMGAQFFCNAKQQRRHQRQWCSSVWDFQFSNRFEYFNWEFCENSVESFNEFPVQQFSVATKFKTTY